jgi:hypothetical protein
MSPEAKNESQRANGHTWTQNSPGPLPSINLSIAKHVAAQRTRAETQNFGKEQNVLVIN